jgi:uncharacterized membrane protein YfcA
MTLPNLKTEAALIVSVLTTVALSLQDLAANGQVSWRNALPVIAGAIIRTQVTSAKHVEQINDALVVAKKYNKELTDFLEAVGAEIAKDEPAPGE